MALIGNTSINMVDSVLIQLLVSKRQVRTSWTLARSLGQDLWVAQGIGPVWIHGWGFQGAQRDDQTDDHHHGESQRAAGELSMVFRGGWGFLAPFGAWVGW